MNTSNIRMLAVALASMAITAGAAQLEIDQRKSKVEVDVESTLDSFVGHLEKYKATVECDPAAALPAKANVSFDFADLKTGEKDRDKEMLKWLEYDSNRTASFHLTGWKKDGDSNIALGNLTIHGVTVAVQMPVEVKHDHSTWEIEGQTEFDYEDFKLPEISKALFLTVDQKLKVKFHLVGKTAAGK